MKHEEAITQTFLSSFTIKDDMIVFCGEGVTPQFNLQKVLSGDKELDQTITRILKKYEEMGNSAVSSFYNQYLMLSAFIGHQISIKDGRSF